MHRLLIFVGWSGFVGIILWPVIALAGMCVAQGVAPSEGFTITVRELGLLWRSVWMSGVATAVSVALAIPVAFAVGRSTRLADRPMLIGAMVATLLCPPMVCAFGWRRALPQGFDPTVGCILVWSLWAWPIPAMILGAGWSRVGRRSFEAAILSTSSLKAFVRGALPLLRPHVGLGALIVFLLLFGDYGVPHAFGLVVHATELLGRASESTHAIDALWPAFPSVAVAAAGLMGASVLLRRCAMDEESGEAGESCGGSAIWSLVAAASVAAAWAPPMVALILHVDSFPAMTRALQTYGYDIAATFGVAGAAAIGVAIMAAGLSTTPRWLRLALGASLLLGALPGAIVGEAVVAAYNHSWSAWLYDHWPIVAVGYAARFGWIGLLAGDLIARERTHRRAEQARTDGATESRIAAAIQLPSQVSMLMGVAAVVVVLSVAEVAASTLLRIPSYNPVAHVIIEKFHRFEDGMMISLSFVLAGSALIGAAGVSLILARHRN